MHTLRLGTHDVRTAARVPGGGAQLPRAGAGGRAEQGTRQEAGGFFLGEFRRAARASERLQTLDRKFGRDLVRGRNLGTQHAALSDSPEAEELTREEAASKVQAEPSSLNSVRDSR